LEQAIAIFGDPMYFIDDVAFDASGRQLPGYIALHYKGTGSTTSFFACLDQLSQAQE